MTIKNLYKTSWVLLSISLLFSCGDDEANEAKPQQQVPKVEVFELDAVEVARIIEMPGTIIPSEEVMIYSEVAGKINQIRFKEGQKVSKGQILLTVDTDILQAQRKQFQVDLALAEKDETRKKALYSGKAISLEEYEKAASSLASIQAQIDLLNTQISKAVVRAPFSGTLGLRQISEGALISMNTPLVRLVQNDPLKIEFAVSEIYAPLLKENLEINFYREKDSVNYSANVYAFEPAVDEGSRMLTVRAMTKNSGNLFPGSFVKLKLDLGVETAAFMVPTESIIPVLKGQKVYVIREGKVAEVMVQTGLRTSDKIQISGDLKEGDKILISGLLSVRPGMPVEIKNTSKK